VVDHALTPVFWVKANKETDVKLQIWNEAIKISWPIKSIVHCTGTMGIKALIK
jgi:hypothetical protein